MSELVKVTEIPTINAVRENIERAKMKNVEKEMIKEWQKEMAEKYYKMASEEESQMEMSAAFGSGVEVVNIITGQRYITK